MRETSSTPRHRLGQRAALALYTLVLWLLRPLYVGRLWWRGRAEARYREAIGERFGRYTARPGGRSADRGAPASPSLWIHAVSLGETRAAAALVAELRRRRPELRFVLTHGTATGREAGAALLGPDDLQAWLPYDTPAAVQGFFAAFRPAVGVLMETEVWPNLVEAARRRGVPIVLANARLSERSQRKARRLEALLRPAVEQLCLVLAQTEADATRLREAGARKVLVAGNVKFDMTPDATLLARGRGWAAASQRPVVLAASTREGEEAALLQAWQASAGRSGAEPRLLVVPRHPQRFGEVAALLDRSGLRWSRRSAWGDGLPDAAAQAADVWLGDSMGEMAAYYAAARVALLGGSFAPLGGQNLIEAAACGCPVITGPHTFNFELAAELAIEAGAAVRVDSIDAGVVEARARCEQSAGETRAAQERCEAFGRAHRGAAARMAEQIAALLPARTP
jgi:3-deoxy-D-manno-octulosonic-acid transferase